MFRKTLSFTATATMLALCLSLAACGGPKSQMQGKYTGPGGTTLEITGDKIIYGNAILSKTFNYTVAKQDGNNLTLDLVSDDKDKDKMTIIVTVDKTAISVNQGLLLDGRWQKS